MIDIDDAQRARACEHRIVDVLAYDPAHKGMGVARFFLGEPDDTDTPLVLITTFPPDFEVAAHKHTSEYVEIILEGSVRVGRTWMHAGEVRQVPAGQVYGPLLTGSEGCMAAVIYRSNSSTPVPPIEGRDLPFGPVA